jgi:hypothetical protein
LSVTGSKAVLIANDSNFSAFSTVRRLLGSKPDRRGVLRPVETVVYEAIPESNLQTRVAEIVADLIADWEADPKGRKVAERDNPPSLIARAQAAGHTLKEIIHESGVSPATFYRWKTDPRSVKRSNTAIVSALRKLASKTRSQ